MLIGSYKYAHIRIKPIGVWIHLSQERVSNGSLKSGQRELVQEDPVIKENLRLALRSKCYSFI